MRGDGLGGGGGEGGGSYWISSKSPMGVANAYIPRNYNDCVHPLQHIRTLAHTHARTHAHTHTHIYIYMHQSSPPLHFSTRVSRIFDLLAQLLDTCQINFTEGICTSEREEKDG